MGEVSGSIPEGGSSGIKPDRKEILWRYSFISFQVNPGFTRPWFGRARLTSAAWNLSMAGDGHFLKRDASGSVTPLTAGRKSSHDRAAGETGGNGCAPWRQR